jgi:hypothetical protein
MALSSIAARLGALLVSVSHVTGRAQHIHNDTMFGHGLSQQVMILIKVAQYLVWEFVGSSVCFVKAHQYERS